MNEENHSADLGGKVVLVTAGGAGIGRVISESFLRQGATVHICDIDESRLNEFKILFPDITASLCDVSDAAQLGLLFADLEGLYGRLDILVNNAGIAGPTAAVEDITIEDWNKTIAVDLSGAFMVTRLAVPLLKRSGAGCIINMSSTAGLFGCPLRSPYVASKWALIGLTKTWAMELGSFAIRVNAICPGSVEGPRIDGVIEREALERGMTSMAIRDVYQRQSSLRKFVRGQDVSNMAIFLCSELGASISGQALSIDGNTESLSNWLD